MREFLAKDIVAFNDSFRKDTFADRGLPGSEIGREAEGNEAFVLIRLTIFWASGKGRVCQAGMSALPFANSHGGELRCGGT